MREVASRTLGSQVTSLTLSQHSIAYLNIGDRLEAIARNSLLNERENRVVYVQAVFDRLSAYGTRRPEELAATAGVLGRVDGAAEVLGEFADEGVRLALVRGLGQVWCAEG